MPALRQKLSKIDNYPAHLEACWQEHLAPRAENAPTVISTFAGAGGSSLGYSMAGYRELLAVEWDNNAVETFKLNFPGVPVYHGDIARLSVDECMSLAGVRTGEFDVLDGSPPCQGFSTAGKREFTDSRNQLFREYVRLLRGLQPKVFVMENVSGMVKGKMKLIFADILRELKASGYRVSARLLNAMWFGVSQSRERMIFIGVREDLEMEPSHPQAQCAPVCIRDALCGELFAANAPTSKRLTEIAPYIKQGQDARYVPADILKVHYPSMLDKMRRHSFENRVRRAREDKPHPVITKQFVMCNAESYLHPREDRYFHSGELKRFASFPDTFGFIGDYATVNARIGNSVPPLMMRAVAEHIRREILARVTP